MKRLSISIFTLLSMLLITSCSDNDDNNTGKPEDGLANITVAVKGQPTSRSIGASDTNPAVENLVSNFTVFVFNYNTGDLEQAKSFTFAENQLTGKLSGISTGTTKRIVAIVNVPSSFKVADINNYSQLGTNLITLESQNGPDLATVGLFMSGETTDAYVLKPGDNAVTIPVKRLVAKVILKSVIYGTDPTTLPNYALSQVSVQKARMTATTFGDIVEPTGDATANYAGGIASSDQAEIKFNNTYNFLSEPLTIPQGYQVGKNIISTSSEERYFYVLPNDGVSGNPTMLTLSGKYGTIETDAYYPFVINGTSVDGSTTDGTFIKSNKIYAITVLISHPTTPSYDPNVVPAQGVLSVTITPQDWDVPIDQNVEW